MNRREMAAAYLLDDLDPAGREDVELERRLAEDAELRDEIEVMRPLIDRLGSLAEGAWPEAARLDSIPPSRSVPRSTRRWSVRPSIALASLLVVAVLGVGLGAILRGGGGTVEPHPAAIVLRPLQPSAGERATVAMPRVGEMVLRASGLPKLAAGEYYELWLMSDARRTVPVASFRTGPDGSALIRVPLPAEPSRFRYFDVSRQAVGGGTAHSADSVLRGPTT
jgi:Anti-sigma-K factor rskA